MEQNPIDKGIESSAKKSVRPQNKHLKPFPKGVSGNPKGYPKGQLHYATMRERALRLLAKQNGKTPLEIEDEINANALLEARKGNFQFYKDDKDRTYGTATIKTDVTSGGKPISILNGIRDDISTNNSS